MEIRLTTYNDLNQILDIYKKARLFMKENNNPTQWKDNRPSTDSIIRDIKDEHSYVIFDKDKILGVFSFFIGKDIYYDNIYDGNWLNDEEYGVIHKVASSFKVKGIMNYILKFAESNAKNIRIDTHKDNKIMQHILEKNGYQRCGIIYVDDNTPRIAYQKAI